MHLKLLVRNIKMQYNNWAVLSLLLIGILLLPTLSIGVKFFSKPNENWYHIQEFLLAQYIQNTLILIIFISLFTILIGVSLAWITSVYEFPFRRFFKWGLILPLAIPPYIGAYTYNGMLNYTGIIQSTLRNSFGIKVDQKYFDIMTMQGTIFIFTAFLFPYVYIITKAFLENQSSALVENARLLGSNSIGVFFRVVLPLCRTAIIGGVSLVILEVLNDYGVVKFFGIQTFSTAIFQAWFGMGDLDSAIKLAGVLMTIVVIILVFEKIARGRKKYSFSTTKVRPLQPYILPKWKGWLLFGYAFTIFSLGFVIPLLQLIYWLFMTYERIISPDFLTLVWNSLFVASISAAIIIIISLIIANFSRLSHSVTAKLLSKVTVLGYSIPGTIIAIGVLTVFIALDHHLFTFYEMIGLEPTLILSLSIVMLIFAYIIRFLAIGYNSVEAGFDKVGTTFTEASRMLGHNITQSFFRVDVRMIKGAVFGGFILVFIDILKELPLTLLLQPFNFYTLATKAFQYANDEMIQEAALASLLIILLSSLSIVVFHRIIEK
ncbi:iron(III) transport system permease protein [Bacillus mesophilus]|uniref:Iron ABC transporter permease n=1 Tax=Bacillus mesophilus TaxID=1808955 RepID=A0A6M0QAB2_9BACI|nr:iron ABC transporter permease [Bacillus mesophilus]MBM7662703.1 iron(III) transport system permease protein [Bacillus mesophilus]NEY73235.1 iron ABC transporter permease [Bacillus mesophilus]